MFDCPQWETTYLHRTGNTYINLVHPHNRIAAAPKQPGLWLRPTACVNLTDTAPTERSHTCKSMTLYVTWTIRTNA